MSKPEHYQELPRCGECFSRYTKTDDACIKCGRGGKQRDFCSRHNFEVNIFDGTCDDFYPRTYE